MKNLTIPEIQNVVADYFNMTVEEMLHTGRLKDFVYPRKFSMYFSYILKRKEANEVLNSRHTTLGKVGEAHGGKDHATVLFHVKRIIELRKNDKLIIIDHDEIEKRLKVYHGNKYGFEITKEEIMDTILNAVLKHLLANYSRKTTMINAASNDIMQSANRLQSGNVSHHKRQLQAIAANLKSVNL